MRSILIIIVTLLVIGGAFLVVMKFQSRPENTVTTVENPRAPTSLPASRPTELVDSQQFVGKGERVWVQSWDSKTGALSNEFYVEQSIPRDGDTVDVVGPQAKFYLGSSEPRQMLVIKGDSGTVVIPGAGNRDKLKGGMNAPPTRGELKNVTIELFGKTTDPEPQIICTMPNAAFDNDQFRIYTEAYVDNTGGQVAADQVPVTVRGKYEFDGKGLEIRWNERDRRLQSMEIAHGDKLIVRDVQAFKLQTSRWPGIVPLDEALAATDPAAAGDVITKPKKKKKKPRPVNPLPENVVIQRDRGTPTYRATFHQNVTIHENQTQIGAADQLFADFIMDFSAKKPEKKSTTQHKPATKPRKADQAKPKQADVEGPIIIRWSGKLRVQPVDDPEIPQPGPEQFNIYLAGAPARLFRQGAEVVGALISWHSGDQGFLVENSEAVPEVLLKDTRGATIWTESIEYGGIGQTAVLLGKSRAELPVPSKDPNAPPQMVHASWTDSCQIEIAGEQFDAMQISRAELAGDVVLKHPQINGRSDTLDMQFDASSDEMMIRQLLATGNADYTITDSRNQSQSMRAERLLVTTVKDPAGEIYPSSIDAQGGVRTSDAEREMSAGKLLLKLTPVTAIDGGRMQIDVESLSAEGEVKIRTNEGQSAQADKLTISGAAGDRVIELIGVPNAIVADKEATLVGPTIRIHPETGSAAVIGAGSLKAIHQVSPQSKPRQIDVSWATDLQLDTKKNLATVNGPVNVTLPGVDGTMSGASGKRMTIVLADAPQTAQPKKKSSASLSGFSGTGVNQKVIKAYQLLEDVEVKSVLTDSQGEILRRMHIFTDRLDYDQENKKLIIPGQGRMLAEDNRKPAAEAGSDVLLSGGGLRGATAFEWAKNLVYDERIGRVDMNGDVRIVHKGNGKQESFDVYAEQVSAEIDPDSSATDKPDELHIRRLIADGGVHFSSPQIRFFSHTVEFDPNNGYLTARAGAGQYSELFARDGASRGGFSELVFDTKNKETKSIKDLRVTVRR